MTTSELKLEGETPAQADVRVRDNFPHTHDANGHFIPKYHEIDGSYPVDEESGLRLVHELMKPWQYPIGHSKYQPHPNSQAAHE